MENYRNLTRISGAREVTSVLANSPLTYSTGLTVKWFTDIQRVPRTVLLASHKDICSPLKLYHFSTSAVWSCVHVIFDGDGMDPEISIIMPMLFFLSRLF